MFSTGVHHALTLGAVPICKVETTRWCVAAHTFGLHKQLNAPDFLGDGETAVLVVGATTVARPTNAAGGLIEFEPERGTGLDLNGGRFVFQWPDCDERSSQGTIAPVVGSRGPCNGGWRCFGGCGCWGSGNCVG